jgi:hypothetical protein
MMSGNKFVIHRYSQSTIQSYIGNKKFARAVTPQMRYTGEIVSGKSIMQKLTTLWQIANAASQVADMARSSGTYRFGVTGDATFYLHTAGADVHITRWTQPLIEVGATLQAPFAWRIETDQDDAGVYFVARRRRVVGSLAGATFRISVPPSTHLILKLESSRLSLDHLNGTVELPPAGKNFIIQQNES